MLYHARSLTILLLSVTLLSCGQSSNRLTAKTDPCTLAMVADAERVLGEPVQEGTLADGMTCVFKAQRHEGPTVTIQVDDTSGKDRRTWFNKERLRRDSFLISGLAEGAIRVDSPSLSRLTFLHQDTLVTVMVSSIKQKHLNESVTTLGKLVATRYGATVSIMAASAKPAAPSQSPLNASKPESVSAPAPVASTQTTPVATHVSTGLIKSSAIDPRSLIGTWHAQTAQGTAHYDMLLTIQPNLGWTLSSMLQFDGVLNAEAGLWSLERAHTFRGLGWKGTYRRLNATSFASTGSIQAKWAKLLDDQIPKHVPTELWKLRREATSVPVFQLKSVDTDLIGQWEGSGTYAGGPATFVWSIQPTAATDLLIIETLKGTIESKDGLSQLKPAQKHQARVSIVALHDGGFTTNDGKVSLRWNRHRSTLPENDQL